uniref:Dirigent protein n=1 Tax=Oryza glumipatula TaxID=40148 RepID=A0A0D9Z1Y3_9ORYZ
MAIPVEEAIAALSTFSLEDEQPDVQGLAVLLSSERYATNSPIEYSDVAAYRLSLGEDTKAINQLNTLIQEGKEMASLLYTYRSCVKALPQLPDSMKHSQADLYLETYQVLDLEMSRLREIQRWQASAASKLAADMQRFSRPERLLLDVLVQLDHLKNAKASIPNDFSWYKRTFTQNSVEDILQVLIVFCVESLELDFALLFPERHTLLRVLPVLVVLATSSEKESESLYKRVKMNRLLNIFKMIILKSSDGADNDWSRDIKGNMYDIVVEGFQLLSRWTGRIWEQCAWKFSRPCKEPPSDSQHGSTTFFDYEKVVRWNYTGEERRALLELIGYIKSIGLMMQRCDTLVSEALWETIHMEVQDFVQDKLDTMLRTTFRKKKDLSRILSDMRTLSADWMANTSKGDPEHNSLETEEMRQSTFYPRPVAPTAAQIHCLQFLICELVSGGNMRKPGGLFGNSGSGIPVEDLKQLETFFYKLSFFLHILDYTATIGTLTDLGFLWFREFYLESSRVIQFPIECSLPWMLVEHVTETQDAGLLESVLIPFDLYNDSAQHALTCLKQRFLYDEIEAEVDLSFDLLVEKLNEIIFTYYKSCAASTLLDSSFTYLCDDGEKYFVKPLRFDAIFKLRRVMVLGRTIDLRSLITQRMNKLFRENIDFLLERFESGDLCGVVIWNEMQTDFLPNFILCNTTQRFVRSLKGTHHSSQRSSASTGKAYFYCGSHDLTMAYQGISGLYRDFFGIPHMFAVVKLLGSRSLPGIIRALLDHISSKITAMVPKITALQEALPKSIGLLSFDGGIAGCQKIVHEILTWEAKSEVKTEVLHDLKEIGSALYWMSLLDIVLRQIDTTQFMQSAPWLGLIPGNDGQVKHAYSDNTPFTTLLSAATNAVASSPACPNPSSFLVMAKQAEAASLLYKSNLNSGSVLEYALAFTSAALDRHYSKWSATPKTGFIDITTSKDFYRVFSGLQYSYLEESINPSRKQEMLGDSVAWAGCTIMYLLGQQQHFELFDFSYQFLNVAEVENATVSLYQYSDRNKSPNFLQGYEGILEAMRKARRLNNHVFSMLRARCPLEDKIACAIKPSGAPLHRLELLSSNDESARTSEAKMSSFKSPAIPLAALVITVLHIAATHAQIPAATTTGAAVSATNPQNGGGGVSGGVGATAGGAHEPLELYMHDILGGSSPTARPITGLLGNIYNGQVPFARPIGFATPKNGVPIPNSNGAIPTYNGNNGIPLDTGLSGAGFLQPAKGASAAQVQLGPDGLSLGFGTITVIDDVLTSGPDLGAQPLGRAQGVYVASAADGSAQMMAFTAMMEGGEYGDTLNFFGVYKVGSAMCKLSITGGTGKFKGACGFAEVRPLIATGQHVTDGAETLLRISVHLA